MRLSRSLAFAALFLLSLTTASVAGPGRITVPAEVTATGQVIRLGDIAVLEGPATAALGDLTLGPAPAAGESRTLEGARVLDALRRAGADLSEITYTIPPVVRVRRASQEVSEAAVRQILEGFLAEALGAGAADAELKSVELPGPIRIPAGPYTARVVPPADRPLLGRVRLGLEFTVEDRPVKSVWVTADIGVYGPVVVATRAVARGDTLAAADLTTERRDLSQTGRSVLTDTVEAAGRIARTPLVPYTPVRRDQLDLPADIHRGDVVLLVAERGRLRITAPGEAREDGTRGQQVHVLNRLSRKDLVGHVVDGSTVAVDF